MTEQEFRQKMKENGWPEENIQACVDVHNEAEKDKQDGKIVIPGFYEYEAVLDRMGRIHVDQFR